MITVRPHLFSQLGDTNGVHFRLVTNSNVRDDFEIDDGGKYASLDVVSCDDPSTFSSLMQSEKMPRPLHVLTITPECGFSSPPSEILGLQCKLLVMPCYSSHIEKADIQHYLSVMEKTDVISQKRWSDNFFKRGEASACLYFVDEITGTTARFDHLSSNYEWFEQLGPIDWGGQQFCPAGEVSVLPLFHGKYDDTKRLAVCGEITLHGIPIVNSGELSFLRTDQERIYDELAGLGESKIVATVENGVITALRCCDASAARAADMLQAMFSIDSRYRILWEVGFGSNTNMDVIRRNRTPNECYGHMNGCVHWGLGLTPWTQYHVDILCPETIVTTADGERLVGGAKRMQRNTVIGCPCIAS